MSGDVRRRALAIGVLLATFGAGMGTGAGLWASCGRPPRHGGFHGEGGKSHRLPPPLEELDLSPEQRTQAETIFEKHRPAFDALFEETRPRMNALREQLDAELRVILTEGQKEKFEQLRSRQGPRGPRP